jgi:hypothetical protein
VKLRKLSLKPVNSYIWHMEKVPGEELIYLSSIKDIQKRKGVWKIMNDMTVH